MCDLALAWIKAAHSPADREHFRAGKCLVLTPKSHCSLFDAPRQKSRWKILGGQKGICPSVPSPVPAPTLQVLWSEWISALHSPEWATKREAPFVPPCSAIIAVLQAVRWKVSFQKEWGKAIERSKPEFWACMWWQMGSSYVCNPIRVRWLQNG